MIRVGYQYQDLDNKALYLPNIFWKNPEDTISSIKPANNGPSKQIMLYPCCHPIGASAHLFTSVGCVQTSFMIYRAIKPVLKVGGLTKVHTEAI
jgi:hypothetical protein